MASNTNMPLSGLTASRVNTHNAPAKRPVMAKPLEQGLTKPSEQEGRLSGGKRDHESSRATDTLNQVPGSSLNDPSTQQPPQKKKKITYQLPRQNMEEGHFYVTLGEDVDVTGQRFKILSLLGEGTFGKVVEIWDRKYKKYGACKVVRNVPKYTRDAEVEIRFMERIRSADPENKFQLMKIERHFSNDSGHKCIVMPKYGPCLLDNIQKNGPFTHRHLAEITFQVASSLDFFHTEMRLMHTDLKPENLLLESSQMVMDSVTGRKVPTLPCRVRICDFGGTCDERHSRNAIVSTRHYRSPEVILGLGWMFSTDAWSLGCIFYELFIGRLLYDTHDNLEHLHMMERTLGRLPSQWATAANEEGRKLFSNGSLRPLSDPKSLARVARCRPVSESIQDELLRDLILGLLQYDRTKRTNMRVLSQHPYIVKYFAESRQSPAHPSNRSSPPPSPSC